MRFTAVIIELCHYSIERHMGPLEASYMWQPQVSTSVGGEYCRPDFAHELNPTHH